MENVKNKSEYATDIESILAETKQGINSEEIIIGNNISNLPNC